MGLKVGDVIYVACAGLRDAHGLCVGLRSFACPAQVCLLLRDPAWACVGLRGPAWACVGLRGPAWACVGLRGPAWVCVGVL